MVLPGVKVAVGSGVGASRSGVERGVIAYYHRLISLCESRVLQLPHCGCNLNEVLLKFSEGDLMVPVGVQLLHELFGFSHYLLAR